MSSAQKLLKAKFLYIEALNKIMGKKKKNKAKDFLKPNRYKIIVFFVIGITISMFLYFISGTYPWSYAQVSNSMAPESNKGDMIFVKATNYDDIRVNDVIVHSVKGINNPWLMRVISKDEEKRTYTTKGDNNQGVIDTERVSQKDLESDTLLGKVVLSLPLLGYLEMIHLGFIIRIILVYLASCIIVVDLLKK